jgi:hypothetical protein
LDKEACARPAQPITIPPGREIALCEVHRPHVLSLIGKHGPDAIHWSRTQAERVSDLEARRAVLIARIDEIAESEDDLESQLEAVLWDELNAELEELDEYLWAIKFAPDQPFIALAWKYRRLRSAPGRPPVFRSA